MRDSGSARRGDSRRSGVNPRGGQAVYPRGASQGTRSRSPAQGGYQKSPPKAGYSKVPEISFAGIRLPLPALRIGTVLLLSAVTVAVILGLVNNANNQVPRNNQIASGVKIDGKDVSGMDVNKLEKQLDAEYKKKIDGISVKITRDGKVLKTLNGEDIGMSDNVGEIVGQAAIIAHSGDSDEDRAEAKKVRAEGREFDVAVTVDPNALKIKLTELANSVSKPGQDATVSFNAGMDDFKDPDHPTEAELDKISSMFTINPESEGQTVDVDAMQKQILGALKTSGKCEVEMAVNPFVPKVTTDSLKKTFSILSVFHTHISGASTAERISNIKTAISKFNSITLSPGQELSFNDTTGPRTADNGYQMAHTIKGNQYVDDWGGGVCQASTTLYNAALLAGCQITDSGHHSIPSDYVPLGFDAMVNYPNSDLKFINPYDAPLYIKTFVTKKNNIYVMFFGAPLPDGEKISLVNDVVYQGPTPDTVTTIDKDGTYADYVTYTDEEYTVMLPHPEIRVDTYRVYKDQSGNEIKREKLREDHFNEIKGQTVTGKLDRPVDSDQPASTAGKGTVG